LSLEFLERRELLTSVVWYDGPSLPAPRTDAAAVTLPSDGLLLVGGGTRSVDHLDAVFDSWSTAPSLDKALVGPGAARTSAGQVFVFGGMDGNESTDEGWQYDFAGDHQNIDQLSTPRADFAAAVDEFNHIYAIGGIDSDGNRLLNSVERYDSSSDSWQNVASLPVGTHGASAVSDDAGHLFVFGGATTASSLQITSNVFRYTIATNQWSSAAPLLVAVEDSAAVVASDGHIYVIGGKTTGGATAIVQEYDPAADTWSINTELPAALHSTTASVDDLGRIVVIGGTNDTGQAVTSVYRSQRLDIPDAAPVFNSLPVTLASLDVPYTYDVHAVANPAPIYSLVTAPDGMTIDSTTGLIAWQPVIGQHGDQHVIVRAANRNGSAEQEFVIHTPVAAPVITSSPVLSGSLDAIYSYPVHADAMPAATYSLVTAPPGMEIHSQTGLLTWHPVEGQQGQQQVIVRAENFVGSVDQSFVIEVAYDTIPPTAPTALTVDSVSTTSITLNWNPADDNRGVSYYEVLKGYRTGWRGSRTAYRVIQTGITGTSTTLTDLPPLSSHKLVVRAVDGGGNISPNSNQVIVQTQAPPTIRYYVNGQINPQVTVIAKHTLNIQLTATANPAPTYALLAAPETMTVDPVTGKLQWSPTPLDVGTHMVTVQATNAAGTSTLDIPVNVTADLPSLGVHFNPNGTGERFAVAGVLLEMQVVDVSFTTSTFELLDAPATMSIDPMTGFIQWMPHSSDAGTTEIVVRGTNSAGSTDIRIALETFFTAAPTQIVVTGQSLLYPRIAWEVPAGEGADLIEGYTIVASVRYRWGRAYRSHVVRETVTGDATSVELRGLLTGKEYKVVISALDGAGNRGALSTETVTVRSVPAVPNVSWTVRNPTGTAIVANQPVEIQLSNLSPDPASFSLISGPDGLAVDADTGLATWLPTADQIGTHAIVFRASNSVGPRDVTVNVNVLFSGAVTNTAAIRTSTLAATVTWSAPVDNVVPVASYQITMHWTWSGRQRSRTMVVPGDQLSAAISLIPTGAVWHRGVTIAPVDELGRVGASTSLVPYAG
jgi:hypothetical protein